MAGRQMSSGSPGSGRNTPARVSPRGSTDESFDLLTGTYLGNNRFVQEVPRSPILGGGTTSSYHNTGSASSKVNPNSQDLKYNGPMQQPMDLLTGIFSPPMRSPPAVVIPASVEVKQNTYRRENAVQGIIESSGEELFATSPIAANNPFVENVAITHGSGISPSSYATPRASDNTAMLRFDRRSTGPMDSTFANFPLVADTMSNLDLGQRSSNAGTSGPPPAPVAQRRVSRTSDSSGSSYVNSNISRSGGSLNNPHGEEFAMYSDTAAKHSSLPSGIGLERLQNAYPRAESPRPSTPRAETSRSSTVNADAPPSRAAPSVPPFQKENARRSLSEPKSYVRVSSMPRFSRNQGKEPGNVETRASGSTSKAAVQEEFVGASSSKSIYKAPKRGAVHPSRPVSLELRPHPLRGAPPNPVTRLTCFDSSVWAACESGLMIWDVESATGRGSTGPGNKLGDEDAAAYEFIRIQGSTTISMVADVANQVVWTGHKDGKMRLWSALPPNPDESATRNSRSARLTFQGHRHAVTALVITSYGELWAGSESGELKAWPWETLAKVLSGVGDGASLMEKSYVELRIRNLGIGPNGLISPEIRFLVGDHANGKVWCAGAQFIALWDARTKEVLQMFGGSSAQFDLTNLEAGSPVKEVLMDEDLKVGYAKVSKKEKGGWLQRSRNAVMGAADAVRRVASGGGQGAEDGRKLEALVAAGDGSMWGGYGNGLLVQWDGNGRRLHEHCSRAVVIRSMCVVGNRVWVGYGDGRLQVLKGDRDCLVGSWVAHRLAVIQMAVCGDYVFSLGQNGSIRGWNISSPDRGMDAMLQTAMSNRADSYTRQRHLIVLAGTWNTAQERASLHSVKLWLGSPTMETSIVIAGLQEVEMGAGAIGMAAVKETVGMGLQERGSATGQWWLSLMDAALGDGNDFERVGSRQLAGMLIGVWVRRKLLPYVGEVEAGAVACGFGRALGNKGAVGVKMMIFRRTICAVTCHLAAHMEHISRRNADFEHIYNQMSFGRSMRINVTAAAAGVSNAVQNMLRGGNMRRTYVSTDLDYVERDIPVSSDPDPSGEEGPELAEADLLIWSGDLNYRIDNLSYEETINLIKKKQFEFLLARDQLRLEMANGRTFHGMREGPIKFQPTYKFDKGEHNVYDTSEKKRIPAWCDRVLFRDSFENGIDLSLGSKLTRPCKATVLGYEACMEVDDSDHKPVRCVLDVDVSVIDEAARRREYGQILKSDPAVQNCLSLLGGIPEATLSTHRVVLEDSEASILLLKNEDRHGLVFLVHCEGPPGREDDCPCGRHCHKKFKQRDAESKDQYPRAGYGFPHWLQVGPAAGFLGPSDSIKLWIRNPVRPSSHSSDQEDKMVVLVVRWKGVLSSKYKLHRFCVCHGPSFGSLGTVKESSRLRTPDKQGRPSSRDTELPRNMTRPELASSSFEQSAPDLLL